MWSLDGATEIEADYQKHSTALAWTRQQLAKLTVSQLLLIIAAFSFHGLHCFVSIQLRNYFGIQLGSCDSPHVICQLHEATSATMVIVIEYTAMWQTDRRTDGRRAAVAPPHGEGAVEDQGSPKWEGSHRKNFCQSYVQICSFCIKTKTESLNSHSRSPLSNYT